MKREPANSVSEMWSDVSPKTADELYYERCPWCSQWVRLHWVESHYQCPKCKVVVESCCEGAP